MAGSKPTAASNLGRRRGRPPLRIAELDRKDVDGSDLTIIRARDCGDVVHGQGRGLSSNPLQARREQRRGTTPGFASRSPQLDFQRIGFRRWDQDPPRVLSIHLEFVQPPVDDVKQDVNDHPIGIGVSRLNRDSPVDGSGPRVSGMEAETAVLIERSDQRGRELLRKDWGAIERGPDEPRQQTELLPGWSAGCRVRVVTGHSRYPR